jgi:hypothetical protein
MKKDGPFLKQPTRFRRVRSDNSQPSVAGDPDSASSVNPLLFIDVHEELDSPNVFGAVIRMDETIWDQSVIVKYAHNNHEYAKLEVEFQNYRKLSRKMFKEYQTS